MPSPGSESLRGRRVTVQALGCRTNLAEAEALASAFQRCGALIVDEPPYDAAVIVTCSVTAAADRKSRQLINRCRRAGENVCVAVCGCWAQGVGEKKAAAMGVDLLIGNRLKSELPGRVAQWLAGHKRPFEAVRGEMGRKWDALELERSPYFGRAFVKVQDGCDHRCTYCIVPVLRGPSASRPAADILAEARRCAAAGQFELILTGVHLGLFGRDSGESFAALIRELDKIEGIKRLRFGSLEPFSIGDDLLEALAQSPRFCRHLHLPVQSGDDEILRRMGRGHTAADYLELVERLRAALGSDLHISTDVMCAFPGESETAFENTLALLKAARVGRVHGFHYSPRPGTPAAAMSGQIPTEIALARAERLKKAGRECLAAEARRWIGREVEVLFEGRQRGRAQGYTRGYFEFRPERESIYDELRKMTVVSSKNGVLWGR